jgi:hypothetical protein
MRVQVPPPVPMPGRLMAGHVVLVHGIGVRVSARQLRRCARLRPRFRKAGGPGRHRTAAPAHASLAQWRSASSVRTRPQDQYLQEAPCGCGAAGSASPCQGEGRGFDPRQPLSWRSRPTGRSHCVQTAGCAGSNPAGATHGTQSRCHPDGTGSRTFNPDVARSIRVSGTAGWCNRNTLGP